MRRLPLYPTVPKAPILAAPPKARNRQCTACALGSTAKNVCVGGFVTGGAVKPGGVLVVLPGPLVSEDTPGGQAAYGAGGRYLQAIVGVEAPVVWSFAIRCAAPGGVPDRKDPRARAALTGCRGYLAEEIRRLRPSRVLCAGTLAATAVFGDDAPATSQVRRAYGWLGSTPETATPVFLLDDPGVVMGIRTLRPEYEADVRWALTAVVGADIDPPAWRATYREVETVADAEAAAAELRATATAETPLTFDVETASTVGLWAEDFAVVSLSFTPHPGPEGSFLWGRAALASPELRAPALALLHDPSVPKAGANVKYDCNAILSAFKVEVRGIVSDTRLESRLYDPDMAADLDTMNWSVGLGGAKSEAKDAVKRAEKALNKATKTEAAFAKAGQGSLFGAEHAPVTLAPGTRAAAAAYGLINSDVLGRYNVRDTVGTAANVARLRRIAAQPDRYHVGARNVWDTLVRDATEVFSRVEARGFYVDRGALLDCADRIAGRIAEEREAIAREAPGLDPDADEAIGELLYQNMKLSTTVLTEGGALSVAYDALAENQTAHPVIPHLMSYGALTHLRRTYLDGEPAPGERYGVTGLLRHIRPDGRVHCTYNLDGARCLPAGELVLTARGYIPAEAVRVGDKVLTHLGRPRPVVEVSVHAPAPIVRVRLSNGLTLRTTEQHGYYTGTGWVPAGELRPGATVAVHAAPERWASVEGWSDFAVSTWGRVRNTKTGRPVTLYPKGRWGHLKATLRRNGAQRRGPDRVDVAVHRLVAMTFLGAPAAPATEVRHLNGLAWDNTVENLAWGTSRENRADAVRHGTMSHRKPGHPGTKLTEAVVAAMRAAPRPPRGGAGRRGRNAGVSDAALASRYGVTRETVRDIRSNKRWAPEPPTSGPVAAFGTATVVSVTREAAEVTYGATVEEDHSHVTGGVVTHNTGRLSASDPNLQNIPRAEETKDDPDSIFGRLIKDLFYAPPGWRFIQLDYSQLELRVAALLSDDPVMAEIFRSGVDYHLRTAEMIAPIAFGVTPAQWAALDDKGRKPYRSRSKAVNFGLLYGMMAKTLAKRMGCDVATATKTIDAVLGKMVKLARWMEARRREADTTGIICTEWAGRQGRFRPLHRLNYRGTVSVNCLDHETEALTRRGWVPGFELRPGEELLTKNAATGALEWQAATDLRLFPDYRGEVVEFASRSFNAVSTPEHRWLVRDKASGADVCRTTANLSQYGDHRIHRTGTYTGPAATLPDDHVELAGWFLTDGYVRAGSRPKATHPVRRAPGWTPKGVVVGLCQSQRANPEKVARIDALLARLGVTVLSRRVRARTECVYWEFRGPLATWLDGTFPRRELAWDFLWALSGPQAALLRDTMLDGDGHRGAKTSFVARSRQQAEAFQALVTLGGGVASVTQRDMSRYTPRSPKLLNVPRGTSHWQVTLLARTHAQVTAAQRTTRAATQGVWCPVVPNTYFVARRRGAVFVTGNTPVQGTASEFCLASVVGIERALEYEGLDADAHVIGTVHDSIVLLAREAVAEEVTHLGKQVMEGHLPGAAVYLEADAEWGDKWGSLEKAKLAA